MFRVGGRWGMGCSCTGVKASDEKKAFVHICVSVCVYTKIKCYFYSASDVNCTLLLIFPYLKFLLKKGLVAPGSVSYSF